MKIKHHIIVKYNETVADKEALVKPIGELFQETLAIPGIHDVQLYPNCVMRENRYDLMIVLTMEREALEVYDHSEAHIRWKEQYGSYIGKKAIFDCEDR